MFHDTVKCLQPSILPLRVLGVCPSALRRLYIPLSNKIYCTLLTIFPIVFSQIDLINLGFDLTDSTQRFLITIYNNKVYCLQHLVLIISTFNTSGDLVRFCGIMESAQRSLHSLGIAQPPRPAALYQILWMVLLSVPTIALSILVCSLYGWISGISFSVLLCVKLGVFCKMRVFLDLLNGKLALLNWHLEELKSHWPMFYLYSTERNVDVSQAGSRWVDSMYTSHSGKTISCGRVREINKAHLKLYYAFKTLNSVFSFPSLVLTLTSGCGIALDVMFLSSEFNPIKKADLFVAVFVMIAEKLLCLGIVLTYCTLLLEKVRNQCIENLTWKFDRRNKYILYNIYTHQETCLGVFQEAVG